MKDELKGELVWTIHGMIPTCKQCKSIMLCTDEYGYICIKCEPEKIRGK